MLFSINQKSKRNFNGNFKNTLKIQIQHIQIGGKSGRGKEAYTLNGDIGREERSQRHILSFHPESRLSRKEEEESVIKIAAKHDDTESTSSGETYSH
jgi:hypothetical protein